jgi:hypothetical protein
MTARIASTTPTTGDEAQYQPDDSQNPAATPMPLLVVAATMYAPGG